MTSSGTSRCASTSRATGGKRSVLKVLQSFPTPRTTTNPYISQLREALSDHVEVICFSWWSALRGGYQVFHVHWPENLVKARSVPRRTLRRALLLLLLVSLRTRGTPVVRTLHNTTPHESMPWVDRVLLRWLEARTVAWVRLNPHTETPDLSRTTTIAHGDYRTWLQPYDAPPSTPGRLLYFGLVRPYKGVAGLVGAFRRLPLQAVSLRIVGQVRDEGGSRLAAQIVDATVADPRMSARLEYVDDAALVEDVGRAELVVLPYEEMHNSGSALFALSVARPVLVPANEVTHDLAREVGPGWVSTFSGALGPEDLLRALDEVRGPRSPVPDLSHRSWSGTGEAHVQVYERAVRRADRTGDRTHPTG